MEVKASEHRPVAAVAELGKRLVALRERLFEAALRVQQTGPDDEGRDPRSPLRQGSFEVLRRRLQVSLDQGGLREDLGR